MANVYENVHGNAKEKVVLAYSGGLDTSVMVKWLQLEKGLDVVAICGNVGQDAEDLAWVEKKAYDMARSTPRRSTCARSTPRIF